MIYNKYNTEIISKVIEEFNNGKNKTQLSKKYNIPRTTIISWLSNPNIINKNNNLKILNYITDLDINNIEYAINNNDNIKKILNEKIDSYSYILGMYLGDGYVDKMKRTYRLRIALDSRQDIVENECIKHLKILFPDNNINSRIIKNQNCKTITLYSNLLPYIFPQCRFRGKKHEHDVSLLQYQKNSINLLPFMKGLFQSDGSFYYRNSKYKTYNFSNKSIQIIDMFSECLINLNILPKISKKANGVYRIQIQNKKDTDILYNILGEKTS